MAVKTAQEGRAARVERAAELIESRSYVVAGPSVYVFSDSAATPGYEVTLDGRCTCADAQKGYAARNGLPCKHELAGRAILAARDLIARRPDVARQIAEGVN